AAALAVLLKRKQRRRWLRALDAAPRAEQAVRLYLHWLSRFDRMKIFRRRDDTLYQFVDRAEGILPPEFAALTETFVRLRYGGGEASEEELWRFLTFHGRFYRGCREHLGRFRYALYYFRL
ncbi:MAG: DUF4129 domain-containing protein, partial [Clostridiales Family XIII bacterium]|nr:DUF4129 domain-containing protein [Clostridiales Family XIII bacterium]